MKLFINAKKTFSTFALVSTVISAHGCGAASDDVIASPKGELKSDSSYLASREEQKRPNFIFILADDLGYTDVGYFAKHITKVNTEEQFYETPNIDKLAGEGVAFSQAYANQLCTPSRATLLTGKFAARMGFTTATPSRSHTFWASGIEPEGGEHPMDVVEHKDKIPVEQALVNGLSQTALPAGTELDAGANEITIAEALKGYKSAFLGKWHVGGHGAPGYQPGDQGFEELAYFDAGASPYFNWRKMWQRTKAYLPEKNATEIQVGSIGLDTGKEFLTEELTAQALSYIDSRAEDKSPFLLYFSHFAVHGPIQAKADDIEYFEGKDTKGWKGQNNATYAAMVKSLDDSVGSIIKKLEEKGLAENTYVIFMSDNGGVDYTINKNGGSGGQKGDPTNPVPTTNTPFVGGKATLYEGGVRVPLVVWKKGLESAGSIVNVAVDGSDIFPTMLEMAGEDLATYNKSMEGTEHRIDGQSLVPLLSDVTNTQGLYTKDTIYWHYPFNVIVNNPRDGFPLTPHSGMREGAYKLIADWHGRLSLFDIEADPFEKNNLVNEEPERVRKMCQGLFNWLDNNVEARYFPSKRPDYDPESEVREEPYRDIQSLEQCQPTLAGVDR